MPSKIAVRLPEGNGRRALIGLGVVLALGALLAAVSLWLLSWPWRVAMRAAGLARPGRSRAVSAALVESTLALALSYFGLRRSSGRVGPAWHPCENCGQPIDLPSRAAYCSQACRRDANIRSRAALEGIASYE